jgi:hypothetical protein
MVTVVQEAEWAQEPSAPIVQETEWVQKLSEPIVRKAGLAQELILWRFGVEKNL